MKTSRVVNMVLLKHHLKALRLPTVSAECEKTARQCAAESMDHLEFLLRVCESELIDRERKAVARRLKAARFPAVKTAGEFDFEAQPAINRGLALELMKCEFVSRKENVLLIGTAGTGKTHISIGLGLAACRSGLRVRFFTAAELVNRLEKEQKQYTLDRFLTQLDRAHLLICDELG